MQMTSTIIKTMILLGLRGFAGLVVAALVGSLLWGVVARTGAAWSSGRPARADELLAAVVAAVALAAVAWLALGLVLGLLSRMPGALGTAAVAVADVVTPRVLRRTAAFVLGVGVVAGIAPGASVAAPSHLGVVVVATTEPDAVAMPLPDPGFRALPDPRWVPSAPTVRPQPNVSVLSRAPAAPASEPAAVVVQRGDTLWSIAAHHLGAAASDAEIAKAWPAWFAANRDVLGEDPDLILPGQVLRAPRVAIS